MQTVLSTTWGGKGVTSTICYMHGQSAVQHTFSIDASLETVWVYCLWEQALEWKTFYELLPLDAYKEQFYEDLNHVTFMKCF